MLAILKWFSTLRSLCHMFSACFSFLWILHLVAGIILLKHKSHHVTPLLYSLQWLLIAKVSGSQCLPHCNTRDKCHLGARTHPLLTKPQLPTFCREAKQILSQIFVNRTLCTCSQQNISFHEKKK